VKPLTRTATLRAIAPGAAKEFRPKEGQTRQNLQESLSGTVAHLRDRREGLWSTQQTADGVRVTRIE